MGKIKSRVLESAPAAAALVLLAALLLLIAAGALVLWDLYATGTLTQHVIANVAGNVGVPAAAIAAFVIVSSLWMMFPPPQSENGGTLEIEVFDLKFTGPAGPITLWVVCFLAFVLAIYLFRMPHGA